jgi:hypothetical protein
MTPLPETLPAWYGVRETEDRGWTLKTSDIIDKPENKEIRQAWNGTFCPPKAEDYTVSLTRLQVISPLQVGGGSFPEGDILPAQVGGVAWIPGSSIRGAFLNWLNQIQGEFSEEERRFWNGLIKEDYSGWEPRKIRFESIYLGKELQPFPLFAQQSWQIYDQPSKNLAVQWQVSPSTPPTNPPRFAVQVLLSTEASPAEKGWLKMRLERMLKEQGIGRGTASGFGRIATSLPLGGRWEIALTGTKPTVQQQISKGGQVVQRGIYRWTPQVLRATLRGYFTRVALSLLSPEDTNQLTAKIFGGLQSRSRLTLTSYFSQKMRSPHGGRDYTNIPAQDAHTTWIIQADCNPEFQDLIDNLLNIACRIGGLGPGWRRPPHVLERFNGFRGSEFTLKPKSETSIGTLIEGVRNQIRRLAAEYNLRPFQQPRTVSGGIVSIWQGGPEAWEAIVHGVCSTRSSGKPSWCGSSTTRPSGYAVREYAEYSWITVFDPQVEQALPKEGFTKIWPT